MQLLGPDVNIAGENIIHDNILDKGAPVVLLLIEGLGIVQGNKGHLAEASGGLIVAGAEHGILEVIGVAHNGLEALLGEGHNAFRSISHLQCRIRPTLSQQRHIGTGNHAALGVDNAEHPV